MVWRRSALTVAGAVRVAVFETGRLSAASEAAPPMLLLHGMGHWTEGAWSPLARHFADAHPVIAIDLPGFGDSERPDVPYDLPFFVRVVEDVVARLPLVRPVLVGHSLGALIAGAYAAQHPERMRALGLIAPMGFMRIPRLLVRFLGGRVVGRLLRARPSRRVVRSTLAKAVYDARSIGAEYHERAFALAQDPAFGRGFARIYAGAMQELRDPSALHARLARYRGPVAIAWGRHDVYVPIRGLQAARRVYPQARVLVLERSAHCPHIEEPASVAAVIRRTLEA